MNFSGPTERDPMMEVSAKNVLKRITVSRSERRLSGLAYGSSFKSEFDELVEVVSSNPCVVNRKSAGPRQGTLLHRCAENNRPKFVEFLIQQGAVQTFDVHGNYPLHYACINGGRWVAEILVREGADLELKNFEGERPLNLAAGCGNLDLVNFLVDTGADIFSRGYSGNSSLHSAAEGGHLHVLRELVEQHGFNVNMPNDKEETALHLACGNPGGLKCAEFLIEEGANVKAMSNDGSTPAHFAAATGCVEVLRVLLDAGALLSRMKQEEGKVIKVSEGRSMLQLVAFSGCAKKGAFLIDRIMNAKNKFDKSNNLREICRGGRAVYKEKEMNEQEIDLVMLSEELGADPEDPNSVFRSFLKKNPESLIKLFDRCLISESTQRDHVNVVFDFFLFKCGGSTQCEMDVIDLIYASGRKRLLEHPIFETFIKLKWERSWRLFLLFFLMLVCHIVSLLGFALFNFGDFEADQFYIDFWWYFLSVTTAMFAAVELGKLGYYIMGIFDARRKMDFSVYWRTKKHLYELANVIHTSVAPTLGLVSLITMNRSITALAVLGCSSTFMMAVTSIPRIGKNVFLTSQVMWTILEFFSSYSAQILAFAITFHILLPGSDAFGNIGDAFLKVLTMLLGEFDFIDTIVDNPNSTVLTKLVFAFFLLSMSIVLMNLVIGLAISDVNSLRKEAHSRNMTYTTVFLRMIGCLSKTVIKICPCISRFVDTDVISDNIIKFEDQVYVNLSDLDYKNSSVLYSQRRGRITTQTFPRRILLSIAEIIKRRNTGSEEQDEVKFEKLLKEIVKINEKVESLTQLLNTYVEEDDFKF